MITPERIASGEAYVEIYPMKTLPNGDATLSSGEPEFYDVMLRPANWEDNDGMAYREWENLTQQQAEAVVADLLIEFPGLHDNWVEP